MAPFATALFHISAFPRVHDYFIPVGNGKVLISLATHLDKDDVAEMAIARVVKMVSDGETQDVCILSLQHVIIVKIDKSSCPTKVTRSALLTILNDEEGCMGADALIATLSYFPRKLVMAPVPTHGPSHLPALPLEITEHIFKTMTILSPGSIPNFALACKQFAAIVADNTVHFPGCTLFPYAPQPSNGWPCVAGVDHQTRELGVYYVAGEVDGGFHIKMYDYLGFSRRGMYDFLGPRRDYDILVDGSKSGLFGLDLALCKFVEQIGYGVITLPINTPAPP